MWQSVHASLPNGYCKMFEGVTCVNSPSIATLKFLTPKVLIS